MNQILDYNPTRNGNNGNNKPLFKVFAVMILIFAIVLIGSGIYSMFQENEQKMPSKSHEKENETKAVITVTEEGSTAIIRVKHDIGIEKVIYKWNNGSEKTTSGNNESAFEKKIDIPTGDNTLYITVIDAAGNETTYEKNISVEEGIDIESPKIEVKVTEDKKLKITATDDTAMDFITYRWNDDEEKIIKASQPNQKVIEETIEILKDTNEIIIVAVDTSNNTTTNGPLKFTGLTKPLLDIKITEDGANLLIIAEHEKGIEKIEYTIYSGDPNDSNTESREFSIIDRHETKVEFQQPLLYIGYNRIDIKITSLDNTVEEFSGDCVYNPTPTNNPSTSNSTTNTSATNTSSNTTANNTTY